MTKQKQRIMAIILIGVLLCIVSLLALHLGTIMIPIGGGIQSILMSMIFDTSQSLLQLNKKRRYCGLSKCHRLIIGLLVGGALALAGCYAGFLKPTSGSRYYGRICRCIAWCRYCYCARHFTSLGMFYMPPCFRRGLCISWYYNSFDFA